MPIDYQQTMGMEIVDRVCRRHRQAMVALKLLNFDEHSFLGETVQVCGYSPMGVSAGVGRFWQWSAYSDDTPLVIVPIMVLNADNVCIIPFITSL